MQPQPKYNAFPPTKTHQTNPSSPDPNSPHLVSQQLQRSKEPSHHTQVTVEVDKHNLVEDERRKVGNQDVENEEVR